ncbi:DUF4440 domain-containing protein [Sphingopyxis panaciterrae]
MPLSLLLAAALTATTPAAAPATSAPATPAPAPMPTGEALTRQIAENDARLFWAAFEGCDPAALPDLLAPEFRMIHDRGGLSAKDAADMVAGLERQCARRRPGGEQAGYRNRRQIVPGSRIIRAMGDWGALEEASHIFFEWNPAAKRWDMVGGAKYMHLWQWIPAEHRFRLSQSYSYDHAGAEPYPPPGIAGAAAPMK